MSLTAYIRYDSTGRLVPGGPIVVADKPDVGNWQPVTQGTNVTLVGQLRAFVKLDRYNKPIASTLFFGKKRPATGKWLEVNATYAPQNATFYNVAGCERMEYHVIRYEGSGVLTEGTIVNNDAPECWFIIDQATGTEDVGTIAYVWNTPFDCQPCINSHTTTTTTTTQDPNFYYIANRYICTNCDFNSPVETDVLIKVPLLNFGSGPIWLDESSSSNRWYITNASTVNPSATLVQVSGYGSNCSAC